MTDTIQMEKKTFVKNDRFIKNGTRRLNILKPDSPFSSRDSSNNADGREKDW